MESSDVELDRRFLGIDLSELCDDSESSSNISTQESCSSGQYNSCDEGQPPCPPSTISSSGTFVDACEAHSSGWGESSGDHYVGNMWRNRELPINASLSEFEAGPRRGFPELPVLTAYFPFSQFDQERNFQRMLSQEEATSVARHMNAESHPHLELGEEHAAVVVEQDSHVKDAINDHISKILTEKQGERMASGPSQCSDTQKNSIGSEAAKDFPRSGVEKTAEHLSMKGVGKSSSGSFPEGSSPRNIISYPVRYASPMAPPQDAFVQPENRGGVLKKIEATGSYFGAAEALSTKDLAKAEAERQRKAMEDKQELERKNKMAREMAAKQAELRAAELKRQRELQAEEEKAKAEAVWREAMLQRQMEEQKARVEMDKKQFMGGESVMAALNLQHMSPGGPPAHTGKPGDQQSLIAPMTHPSISKGDSPSPNGPELKQQSMTLHESESAKQNEARYQEFVAMFHEKIGPFGTDASFKKERRKVDKQLKMEISQVSGSMQQVLEGF